MALIEIVGAGVDIEVASISLKEFRSLTKEAIRADISLFWSDGDCRSGPTNGECELVVDGKRVRSINVDTSDAVEVGYGSGDKRKKYQLVKVEWQRGTWARLEIKGTFQSEKLEITVSKVLLANGDHYEVLGFIYDDEELEFWSTDTTGDDIFILDSKGIQHPLELLDEDEDVNEDDAPVPTAAWPF